MYVFLDVFFLVFHASLVVFNVTGWAWQKTRRVHLGVLTLTFFSWVGLGLFYGFGYCPSTDWHWQVKQKLGETDLPASYVKYYLDLITGVAWGPRLVDTVVLLLSLSALGLSLWLNWRDWHRWQDAGKP
jgi:hypothetical protein